MNPTPSHSDAADDALRDVAAAWVVRQDRRLTAAEQAEFDAWLQADPRHAAAFARATTAWKTFRRIGADVQQSETAAATRSRRWQGHAITGLAAAAALVFVALSLPRFKTTVADAEAGNAPASTVAAAVNVRVLPDGSLVRLNHGADVAEVFTSTERRVQLLRGEAFFSVTKDVARPFIVEAGDVNVRAIGTAFAVQRGTGAVDVVVTEGIVRVTAPITVVSNDQDTTHSATVEAGHQAVVRNTTPATTPTPIEISALPPPLIAQRLAWKDGLLNFGGATLRDVAVTFAHHSGRRILVPDTALAELRIGGQYPSNDLDGFLRVLHELHGVKTTPQPDGAIVLTR